MPMVTNPSKRELVIAAACHSVNAAYNLSRAEIFPQPNWRSLEDDLKDSVIIGVREAMKPGVRPHAMWEKWKETKLAQGWVRGPVLYRPGKEHPNLVDSYDELPLEERRKDELFIQTVQLLQELIGDGSL